ncbi:MAG: ribosome biogenesis/translation initiation ATPase RLI [Candidatus Altiarchaeota archaeon]
MRIAVLDKSRCKPKDCDFLCMRMCPINRTGKECIVENDEDHKPIISEMLCTGCGICVHKCPFDAITIINLPEEVGEPVHQYGVNGFRLYNLPTPKDGVVGLVGSNGIGKSTALKILSGDIQPNLGVEDAGWERIVERFRGKEIQNYLEKLAEGKIKAVYKLQHVDQIPRHVKGKVDNLLAKSDERGVLDEVVSALDLSNSLDKKTPELSGGELQRVAVAAALVRDADVYLFDEPSSYLDVKERLNVAKAIRGLTGKHVFVVEHDLIVLDYLSDYVHVVFGSRGAYGIISNSKGVRVGINEYLSGFLRSENMRFRDEIKFDVKAPKDAAELDTLVEYPALEKKYEGFDLTVESGTLYKPETVGILGPNATGKTTFVKMLAGEETPDNTKLGFDVTLSYKPQYIKVSTKLVRNMELKAELVEKMRINHLLDRSLNELSGGELQKVKIVECLSRDAQVYMLDEPSAYLDVEERLAFAKYIKRFAAEKDASILVVDHDILLVDYLSDEILVFGGEGGKMGHAEKPTDLRFAMNSFLKKMKVTFRRDPDTKRPRANKDGSQKDREQKTSGEYYYLR